MVEGENCFCQIEYLKNPFNDCLFFLVSLIEPNLLRSFLSWNACDSYWKLVFFSFNSLTMCLVWPFWPFHPIYWDGNEMEKMVLKMVWNSLNGL